MEKKHTYRTTETDGVKREYYNSLFTELQGIQKRLHSWEMKEVVDGGKVRYVSDLEKLNLLMTYHNAHQQRGYTRWFIGLTIANLVVLLATLWLQFYK